MKLIHLSDFHLGKRVNEFSMLEDQRHILSEILRITDNEMPDAILIAGDIYDKTVPSAEAVTLFDDFLVCLARRHLHVFLISGNHDSPERLAFGGRLMDGSGIHFAPVYNGETIPFSFPDTYGTVNIYMLPFVKPAHVRRYFPDTELFSYTDAVDMAVRRMDPDTTQRNILVTHQFVTGALSSESEEISVGGTDHVETSVLETFDYVALGHLHTPQNVGSPRIRYCGAPLKYSFSEAGHEKSVTVVELQKKGILHVRTIPLVPLHDMTEIRGTYDALTRKNFYTHTTYQNDYLHITLTDEEDIPDAVGKLRTIYHNLMKLDYDNTRTRHSMEISEENIPEQSSPFSRFAAFYTLQNGTPMSEKQAAYVKQLIQHVWEDGQ